MPHFRLVGDVHGNIRTYVKLVQGCEHSLQLGDMGFSYRQIERDLCPVRHRILGGNHDNYVSVDGRFVEQPPHFLGDFGTHSVPEVGDIFFLRGGHSIDRDYRTEHVDWWRDEELSYDRMDEAVAEYIRLRPDFVVSHECPESVIPLVSTLAVWDGRPIRPSRTSMALENMLVSHRPKLWFFGHHHKSWERKIDGTTFRCLNELETYDVQI